MIADAGLPLFLVSVVGISLTGVMMPGPVTAVTVTKGYHSKNAGALVALGHILVEIPLMLLITMGLARYLSATEVRVAIGLAGGLVLTWMGFGMFCTIRKADYGDRDVPYNSFLAGLITTGANPYFFLWWATVGVALLASAHRFGDGSVALAAVVHCSCDFVWLFFLSRAVFKSRRLWTEKVRRALFGICALTLSGFGLWFIGSGVALAIRA